MTHVKGLSNSGKFDFQNICDIGFIKPSTKRVEKIYFADIKIKIHNLCYGGIIDTSDSVMNIIFNLKEMAGGAFLSSAN